jgi:predicted permease
MQVLRDLRVAMRGLRRAPGVLLITVISLGVGIGSMAAIFGVANTFLTGGSAGLTDPQSIIAIGTTRDDGTEISTNSYPDYLDVLSTLDGLEDASAVNTRILSYGEGDAVRPLMADEVTGNHFAVMGIQPVIGRALLPEESDVGAGARVVMIGHDLWQADFAGSTTALGSTLRINGYEHTIVGVVPDGVLSRGMPIEPDVWVPLGSIGNESVRDRNVREARDTRNFRVLARLSDGVTAETVATQLDVLASRLVGQYPDSWLDDFDNPRAFGVMSEREARLGRGLQLVVGGVAGFFLVAAGLVLLIACANVTTLFLARASNRRQEMAVRVSLGASRRRLVTMFLAEGLIPGLGAGVVGLGVASLINRAINNAVSSIPFGIPVRAGFEVDGWVIAAAFLLSLVASLIFGLLPALEGSRPDLVRGLKGVIGGIPSGRRFGLRGGLVVTQCAASVVLLVGASLFARSLTNAAELDLGWDPDRISIATKKLDAEGLSEDEGRQYIRDLKERLEQSPGVEVAHMSQTMELTLLTIDLTLIRDVDAVGYVPRDVEVDLFWRNAVTPGYLEMMGVPLMRGRSLGDADVEGAPLVAVVNETFAERLWPGRDPIGQTFEASGAPTPGGDDAATVTRSFQVVGLARDGKYFDFDDGPLAYFWTSIYQDYSSRIVVSARGTQSAEAMIPLLRENVRLASGDT